MTRHGSNAVKRLLFFFCLVLASCSPKASPTAVPTSTPHPTALATETWTPVPPPTTITEIAPTPPATPGDKFEVTAWVDKPRPSQNSLVCVHGSLIKNGVHLGGIMMRATWPDKTEKSGTSSCDTLVIYEAGCTVHVKDYPPGVFVPITVTLDYRGTRYTAHTGFTPQ
jgi:hypothetical protein